MNKIVLKKNLDDLKHVLKIMSNHMLAVFSIMLFLRCSFSRGLIDRLEWQHKGVQEIEKNSDFIFVFSDASEKLMDKR